MSNSEWAGMDWTRFVRGITTLYTGGEYASPDGGVGLRGTGYGHEIRVPAYAVTIGPRSTVHEYVIVKDGSLDVASRSGGPPNLTNDAIVVGVGRPFIGRIEPGKYRVYMARPLSASFGDRNFGSRTDYARPEWEVTGDDTAVFDLIFHHSPLALPGIRSERCPHEVVMEFDSTLVGMIANSWNNGAPKTWYVHSQGRKRFDFVLIDAGAASLTDLTITGFTIINAGAVMYDHARVLYTVTGANAIDVSLTDTGEYDWYKIVITRSGGGNVQKYHMKATVRD